MENTQPSPVIAAWVTLLIAHAHTVRKVDRDLDQRLGISISSFDALQQLSRAPGERLRMQELAAAVLLSKSGLTRLVDRLELAGLVIREGVTGDRRSLFVSLTEAGRALVMRSRSVVSESVTRHFGVHYTEQELAAMRALLERLVSSE